MKQLLILCPQGGKPEAEFNADLANGILKYDEVKVSITCLRKIDAETIRQKSTAIVLHSFEEFRNIGDKPDIESETLRLATEYKDVNWWAIVFAERHFFDSSFLLGGTGHKPVSKEFVETLIVCMVRYFESIFRSKQFDIAMAGVADSLIIQVFYQVARHFGVKTKIISPLGWINEKEGWRSFYLADDEFMHSNKMKSIYESLI